MVPVLNIVDILKFIHYVLQMFQNGSYLLILLGYLI